MKNPKKVSNKEIANSLLEILSYNDDAIDYISNNISCTENILGYSPEDKQVQERLKIEKYILHTLNFLDDSYNKSLKKLGVSI